jgi:HEPN domain-containing protein
MSRDPIAEARRWIDQAVHDLDTADLLVEHRRYPVACFLAQQAAEKSLKGLLYHDGADVVLGHSVAALCQEVAAHHPDLASRCATWAALDQHYIPSRYPDALPGGTPADVYTRDQAESATATARDAVAHVRALVPTETA